GEVQRRRDEEAPRRKKPRRLPTPGLEAVVEAVKSAEEVREVGEEAEAEDAIGGAQKDRAAARRFGKRAPEETVVPEKEAQGVVLEESDHAFRRREEIEAARSGGRVEHEEVDLGIRRVLVQRFDAHVLEDAGQRIDEPRVKAVPADSLERLGARGAREEALEGGPGVDLKREEAAALRDAGGAHLGGAAGPRVPFGNAEGLREAPRGIDGEHEGAPPAARGRKAERGRESRFPDAPWSGEDDQLLVVEPRAEIEGVRPRKKRREEFSVFPSGGARGALRAVFSRWREEIFFEGGEEGREKPRCRRGDLAISRRNLLGLFEQ